MKIFRNKSVVALMSLLLLTNSCDNILEPEYRSDLGPEYFSTAAGLEAGLTASYAITRFFWGSEGFSYTANAGTDEMDGRQGGNVYYQYDVNAANTGELSGVWGNSYQAINNLNGILKFGPSANIDAVKKANLLAEAKFMRAFYYYFLVTQFGDIPLRLEFNDQPQNADSRQPIADVYAAIIKDLEEASKELPDVAVAKSRAGKAAALHLLGKVYLTRGWSKAAQQGDFTKSYNVFKSLIDNSATYKAGLERDFGDVWKNGNEYGQESLFVFDRNLDRQFSESGYNNDASGVPAGGNKENRNNHYWVAFYTLAINVNADGRGGNLPGSQASSQQIVTRDLANGRPFRRYLPTFYTYEAFNNRDIDSRYDKTFQKVWFYNRPTSGSVGQDGSTNPINNTITRNGVQYRYVLGDTAIFMPGFEVSVQQRQASKATIISPSQYSSDWYPTMLKYLDPTRLHFNDPSDRPHIMFRLGDSYLLAAEAAFKAGDNANAAIMLNAVRTRAAFRTTNTPAQNTLAAERMRITASTVTLDFILEERTRELFGEYCRWEDLNRTGTLMARVKRYIIDPPAPAPGVTKRTINIKDFHGLRPIPQNQIDLVTSGPKFPQNPGY